MDQRATVCNRYCISIESKGVKGLPLVYLDIPSYMHIQMLMKSLDQAFLRFPATKIWQIEPEDNIWKEFRPIIYAIQNQREMNRSRSVSYYVCTTNRLRGTSATYMHSIVMRAIAIVQNPEQL
jgi:hypothetical protein